MMELKIGDNLFGQRFGYWTVIGETANTDGTEPKWLCRCDCGCEKYVLERSLIYGGSKSCGCLRIKNATLANSHDLTGKTFGELTVLFKAEYQRKNGGIWWTCRCSCGNTYDVSGTLLVNGRRTNCPSRTHERNYASSDITGQRFYRLVAEYPTQKRDSKGSVIWHCQCDCGHTVDVSYNHLVYSNMKSCGCRKIENNEKIQDNLIRIDGTSLDMIRSKKVFANNTTGYRGVYLIRGKYVAKLVFQKKGYYLGAYKDIKDAVKARAEAEAIVFDGTAAYYESWEKAAAKDPLWAEENPVQIRIERDPKEQLKVEFIPSLSVVENILTR